MPTSTCERRAKADEGAFVVDDGKAGYGAEPAPERLMDDACDGGLWLPIQRDTERLKKHPKSHSICFVNVLVRREAHGVFVPRMRTAFRGRNDALLFYAALFTPLRQAWTDGNLPLHIDKHTVPEGFRPSDRQLPADIQ
jgi:hypothetical protein